VSALLGISSLVAVSVAVTAAPAAAAVDCPAENVYLNTTAPNTLREVSADGTVVSSIPLSQSYGDIGFSADGTHLYGTLLGINPAPVLIEIDKATGAELSSVPISSSIGVIGNPVALSPLRDGRMLIGFTNNDIVYTVDVTTGVATPFARYPAGYFPTGDFIQLGDGDILMSGSTSQGAGIPTTLFRLHPDGTTATIGTIPTSYGLTQAEGVVYTGGPDQMFRSIDSIPTASSTDPLPTTAIASMGAQIYGMTSIQDPGCGPYFQQTKTSDQTTYNVGATVTYTVTATNSRAYAGTADLADALPATVSPVDVTCTTTAPGTCSVTFSGQNVTGTTTIPPGGTTVFTITATAVAGGLATNTATITPTDAGCDDGSCGGGDASTSVIDVIAPQVGSVSIVTNPIPGDENGDGSVNVGETVAYTFTVTNTGTVTLTGVGVTDLLSGSVTCPTAPLAPGASVTCTGDNPHTVTQADLISGAVTNTGTATATPPAGVPAVTPATDTATTPVAGSALGSLSLVTTATPGDENGDGNVDPGETVSYTFEVTNTGTVTLNSVTVTDQLSGSVTCPTAPLAPGATMTCTGDNPHTVTEADLLAGSITNTGTADATPPAGVPAVTPATDTATTPVAGPAAGALSIVTNAVPGDENGDGVVDPGETISYTFTVTNTGNVTVTDLSVVDGLSGSVTCPTAPLAPGATATCTGDNPHTVTEADIRAGLVSNTGTADGTTPAGVPPLTPVSSTATTPTAPAAGALDIVTTAIPGDENGNGSVDAGETISYTFTVTNTGTVTLTDVTVTDQLSGSVTCPTTPLAPGATIVCTGDAPHTVTDADVVAGQVVNMGTADATTPAGVAPIVPPSSTATTPTATAAAALSIVTTAVPGDENGDGSVNVGETVSYTFTVTNTGTVTITDPTVTDQLSGSVSCPAGPLAPGQTITCTGDAPHTVTDADVVAGQISNTGTADGTAPVGVAPVVPPTSTATTPTVPATSSLDIVTTAVPGDENGDGSVGVGETVSYTFTVTNTGTVTLTDVTVTDQLSGSVTCPTGPLAPGATIVCTGDAPHTVTEADLITGEVVNTGTADATTPPGAPGLTPPSSTVTTPVAGTALGELDIVTTATPGDENGDGIVDPGETVSYTFTVTNTGTVTLTDVTVTDQLSGSVTCPAGPLAPGQTITCTGDSPHAVTEEDVVRGEIVNTGTADGTPPAGVGPIVPATDTVSTPTATALGRLSLVTTAVPGDENGNGTVDAGETISYTFTVTNTGNVTLTDVTVTDQLSGSVTCPAGPLAPGESIVCHGDNAHVVTAAEALLGTVANTGTANATPPAGVDPVSPATSTVTTLIARAVDVVPAPVGPTGPDGALADTGGSPVTGSAWWAMLAAAVLALFAGAALLLRRRRSLVR
jgi:uncharacterized repeat protein (TIGR01451 family)